MSIHTRPNICEYIVSTMQFMHSSSPCIMQKMRRANGINLLVFIN